VVPWTLVLVAVFAAALLLGRAWRPSWAGRAVEACILAVVASVGFWGGEVAARVGVGGILFRALAYTVLIAVCTVGLGVFFGLHAEAAGGASGRLRLDILASLAAGGAAGWLLGGVSERLVALVVEAEVTALLFFVGLSCCHGSGLGEAASSLRLAGEGVAVSLAGGVAAGVLGAYLMGCDLKTSLLYTLGMGWYSFAGPYAAVVAGGGVGVSVFLANLLREQVVYIAVPLLKRPLVGLLALGGATSMDNTLPVYVAVYGEEVAPAAVLQGLVLTLLVPPMLGLLTA